MPAAMPFLGIDFGTSRSKMAWYNSRTRQAEIIRNAEGKEQTPSAIYVENDGGILVGEIAEKMLGLESERLRVETSIKRRLLKKQYITLADRKFETAELAAAILRKLKRDAETLHFHQEVLHAVITVPATFSATQKERLRRAAELAGFRSIQLLEEPAAAALAYMHQSLDLGRRVLVYDLGAGTFDLALVAREPEGAFRRIVRSRGEIECGGDDIDDILYDYCDRFAQQELGRSLNSNGERNLTFLQHCRAWKEELSHLQQHTLRYALENAQGLYFQQPITRAEFEEQIQPLIQKTVQKTQALLREDQAEGYSIDSIVLIGGSSRIPLVQRLLSQALPVPPLTWEERDFAVALGAAHQANLIWKPEKRYRWAVDTIWKNKILTPQDREYLAAQALDLDLSAKTTADVERSVMGETKERILARQQAIEQYSSLVKREANQPFTSALVARLADQARKLGLNQANTASVERALLGRTREERLAHDEALARYREEIIQSFARGLKRPQLVRLADLAHTLGLSEEEAAQIESRELGSTKERLFAHQQANERYTQEVKTAWQGNWLDEQKVERLRRIGSQLPLGPEDLARIERNVMGDTKEALLRQKKG